MKRVGNPTGSGLANGDKLITAREAADLLGMSLGTFRHRCCRGEIPLVRTGPRSVRFSIHALQRWVEERSYFPEGVPADLSEAG